MKATKTIIQICLLALLLATIVLTIQTKLHLNSLPVKDAAREYYTEQIYCFVFVLLAGLTSFTAITLDKVK